MSRSPMNWIWVKHDQRTDQKSCILSTKSFMGSSMEKLTSDLSAFQIYHKSLRQQKHYVNGKQWLNITFKEFKFIWRLHHITPFFFSWDVKNRSFTNPKYRTHLRRVAMVEMVTKESSKATVMSSMEPRTKTSLLSCQTARTVQKVIFPALFHRWDRVFLSEMAGFQCGKCLPNLKRTLWYLDMLKWKKNIF